MRVRGVISAMASEIRESVSRRLWHASERMPSELRCAHLLLSEANIRSTGPVRLHGRVDQVYRLDYGRGELMLVDSKMRRRDRVELEDVMQLSAYALILRLSPLCGHEDASVSNRGYLRFVWGGVSRYRQVSLYPKGVVLSAYREYIAKNHREAGDDK